MGPQRLPAPRHPLTAATAAVGADESNGAPNFGKAGEAVIGDG